ncbi:phosphomevalonate kinase [Schizopora paradoxa]|uniref:Phosphomevalonate kinase n=1 Tax=Schizopora paradoxa TaxID=27342 RepID=A0A0H2S5H3_9AGAM|nr:phosphomevalonate kinase [Schizopora paradoxa]
MSETVVSASGKVLVAGGYLVLDPKYSGLVVSTSSRFYTCIRKGSASQKIVVKSPQFQEATWNYSVEVGEGENVDVVQSSSDSSKNKFVHLALQKTFRLVLELKGREHVANVLRDGLDITIAGDNDFYSQRAKLGELGLKPILSSLSKIPPFAHTGVKLSDVHKTGLGSSAALITSLVAALLLHFNAISVASLDDLLSSDRQLAHNAAQFIHCLAQGKVGSGFDVSAAIFGSQLYRRFEPSVIDGLMSATGGESGKLIDTLSPSNKAWNYVVKPFQLPPCTRLMLADVDAGSDTPSLVGKVLKWRQAEGEAAHLFWDQLGSSNDSLAKVLLSLTDLYAEDKAAYEETIAILSRAPAEQWSFSANGSVPIVTAFQASYAYAEDIRSRMREMGSRAGVPIEPPEQTELLNACIAQPGVVGCGVPGAGGYDAIWVLVLDPPQSAQTKEDERPLHHVENVWASWTKLDVSPLSATESFEKGFRLEKTDDIPGLRGILS